MTTNRVIAPDAASQYKRRRPQIGKRNEAKTYAKKDQPDTVDVILNLKKDYGVQKALTKVNIDKIKNRLKMEEVEAWKETTKNIAEQDELEKKEVDVLKKLMTSGQKREDVDVRIIDRIKEGYLEGLSNKMEKVKGIDALELTADQIREQQKIHEKRKLGIKAFQAKTTYEIGVGDEPKT